MNTKISLLIYNQEKELVFTKENQLPFLMLEEHDDVALETTKFANSLVENSVCQLIYEFDSESYNGQIYLIETSEDYMGNDELLNSSIYSLIDKIDGNEIKDVSTIIAFQNLKNSKIEAFVQSQDKIIFDQKQHIQNLNLKISILENTNKIKTA